MTASRASVGLIVMTLLTPAWARGQQPLPLLGVEVKLAHYGIAAPAEVVRGRVSIVYAAEGPRLVAHYLRDTPPPPRPSSKSLPPPAPEEATEGARPGSRQRAMWVWTTRQLLDDASRRAEFLDFVEAQRITRVFLYLPAARDERPRAGFIPFDGSELGPLLADLRRRGALTYALDGDRDYVRPANHPGVYRTVERLVAHNLGSPEEERFHGVRYDIEPYLADGFQGPARQELLDGWVELIAGVARRAHDGGLVAAVDIPFWLDAPDEETGAYLEATLEGRPGRVLDHLMSVVDDVGIMDYRTRADGPNGMLVHARTELALGAAAGVGVFLGVETTRLFDEDLHTFFGPAEGAPPHADARWIVLEARDGADPRLWLVDGEAALAELARRTRWATSLRHWPAGRPARVAAGMQSFHDLGAEAMRAVTDEVQDRLSGRPAFLGLAFHDYRGLRDLLGER